MKRRLLILIVLGTMLLMSCKPTALAIEPTVVPSEPAVSAVVPTQQSTQPAAIVNSGPATCKAGSDPLPLPEITEEDWSVGPSGAKISILEYSDYQ